MLVYIFKFLFLPVGVCERLRDESHGRQVIFMGFAALICQQCLPISKCRCTGFSDLPRTFPLFSPEISKLESQFTQNRRIFAWQINSAECTKNLLSPRRRICSISSHLLLIFMNREIEQPNPYKIKNLSSSGSSSRFIT